MGAAVQLPETHPPRLFKRMYLAPDEGVIRETRATAWYYFPGPIFLFAVSLFLLYAAWVPASSGAAVPGITAFLAAHSVAVPIFSSIWLFLFLVLTIVVLVWLGVRYLLWGSNVYGITPRRAIVQRGIFSRDFDQIPIVQIRGVRVHQTLWQRLFRYGTVVITSEGETPDQSGQEEWEGVPHAFDWPRLIDSVTQARNQMSIDEAASAAVTAAEKVGVRGSSGTSFAGGSGGASPQSSAPTPGDDSRP